jgi:hypothetical protein
VPVPSWLAALEHLVTAKGLTDRAALGTRKEVWAEAYRHAEQAEEMAQRRALDAQSPALWSR